MAEGLCRVSTGKLQQRRVRRSENMAVLAARTWNASTLEKTVVEELDFGLVRLFDRKNPVTFWMADRLNVV